MKFVTPLVGLVTISVMATILAIAFGYRGTEFSNESSSLWGISYILLVGWWIDHDRKTKGFDYPFEFGPFIFFLWPITLPHYAYRTRGIKGLGLALGIYALALLPTIGEKIGKIIAT